MRYLIAVLALGICCAGCTTVQTTALYEPALTPDGSPVAVMDAGGHVVGIAATKRLEQTIRVSAGGKVDEGMLNLTAESVAADGSNWTVKSGTNATGAQSPDVTGEILQFATSMASQAIGAYQATSLAQTQAATRAAELNASAATTTGAVEAALKAAGK